jgi:pectin methylesterase-like acyl-CoA thioesterase
MGKNFAAMLVLIFLVASCVNMFLPVKAESRTIIVPDDYSTIQDAINAANEGDTIFVKKGIYEGPINQTLVISKSLSLIGEDANNNIINLHPAYTVTWIMTTPFFSYSDAITINANDVKLLNLTIIIASPGGYISATGDRTQIIGNNISTGPTTGLLVSGSYCNITENSSGGLISLKGSSNTIARNLVQ